MSLITLSVFVLIKLIRPTSCTTFPLGVRSIAISLSVCLSLIVYLSVCLHIAKITRPNFTVFSVHTYVRGSVLLCTWGFADDVMFSYDGANGPESKTTRMFRPVRQVAASGAKYAVSY